MAQRLTLAWSYNTYSAIAQKTAARTYSTHKEAQFCTTLLESLSITTYHRMNRHFSLNTTMISYQSTTIIVRTLLLQEKSAPNLCYASTGMASTSIRSNLLSPRVSWQWEFHPMVGTRHVREWTISTRLQLWTWKVVRYWPRCKVVGKSLQSLNGKATASLWLLGFATFVLGLLRIRFPKAGRCRIRWPWCRLIAVRAMDCCLLEEEIRRCMTFLKP